jgi:tetratricopeptide (TPR) repeat protein
LAICTDLLGELLVHAERRQEAEDAYEKAATVWRKLIKETNLLEHRARLAANCEYRGRLFLKAGHCDEAEKAYQEAVTVWQKLVSEFDVDDHRRHLIESRSGLLESLVLVSKHEDASKVAEQVSAPPPNQLWRCIAAAGSLELCVTLAEKDTKLPESERQRLARAYAKRSKELKQEAVKRSAGNGMAQNSLAWFLATSADLRLRDPTLAVELAKQAVAQEPHNPSWLNTLGTAYCRSGAWKEAVTTLQKSNALFRGESSSIANNGLFLAIALWHLGDKDKARRWYAPAALWIRNHEPVADELVRFQAEAAHLLGQPELPPQNRDRGQWDDFEVYSLVLQADPDAAWAYHRRRGIYLQRGDSAKAQMDYRQALVLYNRDVEAEPDQSTHWITRGLFYAELDKWENAAADFAKATELDANRIMLWYWQALARLGAGDVTGYRSACAAMLKRFGRTNNPTMAHWVAWSLVLAPDSVSDWDGLLKTAELAFRNDPRNGSNPTTLGAALFRAGRISDAIQRLNDANNIWDDPATKSNSHSPAYIWFFQAMANQRMGHADEASRWLERGVSWMKQEARHPSDEAKGSWNRRLTLQLLRREAEAVQKQTESVEQKTK